MDGPARQLHLDSRAIALVLGCTLVWGIGQLAAKVALAEIPALTQAGLRSLGAGVLVFGWTRLRGVPLTERDGTWWPGLLAGVLFAAEFAAVYSALRFTTAGRTTVFLYLAPFVVAIGMARLVPAERLRGLGLVGLVAAFGGVAVAFLDGFTGSAVGPQQWLGDLLAVGAAVGWGATTLVIRATPHGPADPAKTLLYQLLVSGVGLTAAGFAVGERPHWPFGALTWAALVFQVCVVSSTSYLVWFWLVRTYAATRLSAFTLLTPVVALLAGALLLHESLTPRILVAVTGVALGLVLVNRTPRRLPPPDPGPRRPTG